MKSEAYFEAQFQRQVRERDYALNPFEILALDHLVGRILDLGSGLGNLSLEAARRGHPIVAVDASATAVARIEADARREGLDVRAIRADASTFEIAGCYDTIVSIGLLMFFPSETAHRMLRSIREHVAPGGRAVVNVLVEGTTFLEMFDPAAYTLFGRGEVERAFAGWRILASRLDDVPAPGDTRKAFSTVIAQKPAPDRP